MKRRNFLKNSMLSVGALGLSKYAFADNSFFFSDPPKPVPTFGDPASDYLTAYI